MSGVYEMTKLFEWGPEALNAAIFRVHRAVSKNDSSLRAIER